MKFAIVAVVCLSMVVFATANDLSVGEREEGDVLVASRRLFRPAVPGKPMVARSGFNAAGTITAVRAANAAGSDATITVVKGGPGERNVVVLVTSAPGSGIDVQLDIYATTPGGEVSEPASP